MDILRLYRDFNISHQEQGHKHCRPGWVQTACPFCSGNPGYHLGYCIDPKSEFCGRFVCWRCGGKGFLRTLSALLKISEEKTRSLLPLYGGKPSSFNTLLHKKRTIQAIRNVRMPSRTLPITDVPGALHYLEQRGFDPSEIGRVWKIQATGPGSLAKATDKTLNFSYRIIIPVSYQKKIVSYQGRDWTGKQEPKYLACPPELESKPLKSILYGLDETEGMDSVVLVEGVTDVWKIGAGAVACFGIKYREEQVRELVRRYKRITVAFDPEPQAKIQAQKIIRELRQYSIEIRKVDLPVGKDPGDLTKNEIMEILRKLKP